MEKWRSEKDNILMKLITRREVIYLLIALGTDLVAYYGGRLLSQGKVHVSLAIGLDDKIPFLPWTVIFYVGWYLFWAANYILAFHFDEKIAKRFLAAHILGEIICFFIFFLLPTTMVRGSIEGKGLWEFILRLIYSADTPDNLFPSLHCYVSWMCWIAVRSEKKVPRVYRMLSLVIAVCICISTLTVKQHVFADLVSGVLLAEVTYLIAGVLISRRQKG